MGRIPLQHVDRMIIALKKKMKKNENLNFIFNF